MKALILVDIQNDFYPGGSLAVPDGDSIVPVVNRLQKKFDLVVATQDWHPRGHGSFASTHGKPVYESILLHGAPQTLWPDHCVQGTPGAELVAGLDKARIARVFQKGTDPAIDSYSGFLDADHKNSTGLADYLRAQSVTTIYIAGLATDYCVKYTALDAAHLGFRTHVIADACRGVNLQPGDSDAALAAMKAAGVKIIRSISILKPTQPGRAGKQGKKQSTGRRKRQSTLKQKRISRRPRANQVRRKS
jgi:nicotinamidase/pyrazinamidase